MHGATEEEIDQAVDDGVIDLFVADRLLVPSRRRYTRVEVAELTGCRASTKLERFWRALGFPGVDDDDRAFTDLDLEAVRLFQGLQALGAADTDTALQMARVIGSSMARIAEAELVPGDMVSAEVDPVMSADAFAGVADVTIPAMAKLLEFVWRRQVAAGIQRTMMLRSHGLAPGQSPVLAVGFADMVGFTLLSQHLSDEELAAVVRRFEEISHDIVTSARGRVVKMIGDEVMFVVDSVADAARIGLDLADAYADDELLSDVRVGLACGPVLLRDGDYFGPTVNLAHRIVNIGNPGTVLMSDEFHTALAGGGARRVHGAGAPPPAAEGPGPGAVVVVRPGRPGGGRHGRRGRPPAQRPLGAAVRGPSRPRGAARRRRAAAHRQPRARLSRRGAERWRCRRGVARTSPRRAAAGSRAGRRASPSDPGTRPRSPSAVGLKTRTSSTPATRWSALTSAPCDRQLAARRPDGCHRPRLGTGSSGQQDVVGQRVGVVAVERQRVAQRRPACPASGGPRPA